MNISVFSMNKYKSDCIKRQRFSLVYNPPSWTFRCEGREVRGSNVLGTAFSSETAWTTRVDEKYVRR